jgi:hypothetical protein
MRAYTIIDVIPIFIPHVPNLLDHNNVGVIYPGTSNFRMELIRHIPLYFVAMFKSTIIVIEAPL